jgi:antitoxin CptB
VSGLTQLADRMHDRLRWRCRRGMLELDLVLNAFLERHLDGLEPAEIEAFKRLLARPDPELLDLVMGHEDAGNRGEEEVLAKIRRANG